LQGCCGVGLARPLWYLLIGVVSWCGLEPVSAGGNSGFY